MTKRQFIAVTIATLLGVGALIWQAPHAGAGGPANPAYMTQQQASMVPDPWPYVLGAGHPSNGGGSNPNVSCSAGTSALTWNSTTSAWGCNTIAAACSTGCSFGGETTLSTLKVSGLAFSMTGVSATNVIDIDTPDSITSSTFSGLVPALRFTFDDLTDNDVGIEYKFGGTVEARLYETGEHVQVPSTVGTASNGAGTRPQASGPDRADVVFVTCNDPDGCEYFLASCQYPGSRVSYINVGVANNVFIDNAYPGTSRPNTDFDGPPNSTISFRCDNNEVWFETGRSVFP